MCLAIISSVAATTCSGWSSRYGPRPSNPLKFAAGISVIHSGAIAPAPRCASIANANVPISRACAARIGAATSEPRGKAKNACAAERKRNRRKATLGTYYNVAAAPKKRVNEFPPEETSERIVKHLKCFTLPTISGSGLRPVNTRTLQIPLPVQGEGEGEGEGEDGIHAVAYLYSFRTAYCVSHSRE